MADKKVYWRKQTRLVDIPMCPNCNREIDLITDEDHKTIATYHCKTCFYTE